MQIKYYCLTPFWGNTKGQRFRLGIAHAVHMQMHVAFFSCDGYIRGANWNPVIGWLTARKNLYQSVQLYYDYAIMEVWFSFHDIATLQNIYIPEQYRPNCELAWIMQNVGPLRAHDPNDYHELLVSWARLSGFHSNNGNVWLKCSVTCSVSERKGGCCWASITWSAICKICCIHVHNLLFTIHTWVFYCLCYNCL